ncbi:salicylate carboxymethyltransferase-like [Dorcoceras hygrometricum]|uniref:Salicylate carboxymethyltransferase-like n=1 Tax=Dorcoceras hygrometricum TaxID=472368 RepID=A0A2Z7DDS6_9LAMI|nr:salicylate carboxymethyltransferase-like [Dorcoceras hygrometricum]
MEVFLDDLEGNDFNNLFKLLPSFYKNLRESVTRNDGIRCFVSCLPGPFYCRLFPSHTLNFVYSSFSLQWLSKVPDGLENNKESIHWQWQVPAEYERVFTTFLASPGEEVVRGGPMVLICVGPFQKR